jgi:hypothetical protein
LSALGGMGLALMWVGQGEYMGECSDENTIYNNQGIFWAIFCFNGVIGNVFAIILLQEGELRIALFGIMSFLSFNCFFLLFCTVIVLNCLVLPIPEHQSKPDLSKGMCEV